MASTPYKPVSWGTEPITQDKLNTMASNEQWLFENTPRVLYNVDSLKRTSGVKILSGMGLVKTNGSSSFGASNILFGTFFSSGCKPIVVATACTAKQGRISLVTRGIDHQARPDYRGFQVLLSTAELTRAHNKLLSNVYIPYIAIGW